VKYNLWLCAQHDIEVTDEDFQRIVQWLIGEFYGEEDGFKPGLLFKVI